jgi:cytosolic carboxypeptidase protein 5
MADSTNHRDHGITIRTPAHSNFEFSNGVKFSSDFDNGNMVNCEMGNKKDEYRIWTAPDCAGTDYERSGKPNAWFYFTVEGVSEGTNLKICIVNASNHSGLYKHDMRPVYKSNASNQKWARLKTSVKFIKHDDGQSIYFDYRVELPNEQLSFAFTFPYTYTTVQNELNI